MDGKIFESNLMGIGQEKDFYKLRELNYDELAFITYFIGKSREHLQHLHKDLVSQFNNIFSLRKEISAKGIHDQKLNDMLDIAIHNFEENLHTDIEGTAAKYIRSILEEDIRFYKTDKGCREFIYFLCVQYLRTKKIRESATNLSNNKTIDLGKISNIINHIAAVNMGWVFYAERKFFKMILLKNTTTKELITGDQPVINTYGVIGESKIPLDNIELYYPVSPKLAILISEKEEYRDKHLRILSENDVTSYNNMIVKNSHSQVYAASRNALEEFTR